MSATPACRAAAEAAGVAAKRYGYVERVGDTSAYRVTLTSSRGKRTVLIEGAHCKYCARVTARGVING